MRATSIFFMLAALCCSAFSLHAEIKSNDTPPLSLTKEGATELVKEWASFAGGAKMQLESEGNEILIMYQYGSGCHVIKSLVYVLREDKYVLVRDCPTSCSEEIEAHLNDKELIMRTAKSKTILCTISLEEIKKAVAAK